MRTNPRSASSELQSEPAPDRALDALAARPLDWTGRIKEAALGLGFDAVGIGPADVDLEPEHGRYLDFLARGYHGTMGYLAEDAAVRRRLDGPGILEGARSVICVARDYRRGRRGPSSLGSASRGSGSRDSGTQRDAASVENIDEPSAAFARALDVHIARYARGKDYHAFLRRKVRQLAAFVRRLGPEGSVHARPMVDTAPVLERAWAARTGLGFVGKNGLLIVPGRGSMVLLAEVATTAELVPDSPMAERCGSCTRCLEACPTQAFSAPWVLDARKCVSYLTIEHRGPIDDALKASMGQNLFGCDDCQTVCPFNAGGSKAAGASEGPSDPRGATYGLAPFVDAGRWHTFTLVGLLGLNDDTFAELTRGTPLSRATRAGLVRNACIVLANRGEVDALPALRARLDDEDEGVRDGAHWAVARLERR